MAQLLIFMSSCLLCIAFLCCCLLLNCCIIPCFAAASWPAFLLQHLVLCCLLLAHFQIPATTIFTFSTFVLLLPAVRISRASESHPPQVLTVLVLPSQVLLSVFL